MTPDEFNTIAWRDFVVWAWNTPALREQFTASTGIHIQTATNPIEAAIDTATGAAASHAAKFIEWVTREHWGLEHAPATYQSMLTAK